MRIKNKSSQQRTTGYPVYQIPVIHYPEHSQIPESHIHGNHVEAQNAALRRKCSPMRRRTNTYAKATGALQRALDVQWIVHNFVRPHFTTGHIPAVAMGIVKQGISLTEILTTRPLIA